MVAWGMKWHKLLLTETWKVQNMFNELERLHKMTSRLNDESQMAILGWGKGTTEKRGTRKRRRQFSNNCRGPTVKKG